MAPISASLKQEKMTQSEWLGLTQVMFAAPPVLQG